MGCFVGGGGLSNRPFFNFPKRGASTRLYGMGWKVNDVTAEGGGVRPSLFLHATCHPYSFRLFLSLKHDFSDLTNSAHWNVSRG